jgi:dihydroflavonol-4-reductase
MADIFVTGGTGFLGRHLVPALCRAGYTLRVLTRTPERHPWLHDLPRIEIVQGDLRDAELVARSVQGCRQVVHAAGLFSMWYEAGDFDATNVVGTENILAAARAANVERVVYVSTIAVIGKPMEGRVIDEQHPVSPADPYQASKWQAEQVVFRHIQQGLPALIVRPGAFYGPMGDYAFNRLFFTDPMRGITMQMDGGRYTIFPAYIGDVAEGIRLALEKGRMGEIYNLCGECVTHRAAFDSVYKEAHLHWPRLNIPGVIGIGFSYVLEWLGHLTHREPFYPLGLRSYVFQDWPVSSDKARKELGFLPISFAEGVKKTIAWYKAGKPDTLPELMCKD